MAQATIYVDASNVGDPREDGSAGHPFDRIQEGINAAASGGTVQVAAGIYYERITLRDGVDVLGAGCDITTIDGGGSGIVVYASNIGPNSRLDGFTIINGNTLNGGGMHNDHSSPTVANCTFSGNTADSRSPTTGYGGGMYNNYSSPMVTNCTFSDNSAESGGGGMHNDNSSPMVSNCTFSGNSVVWGGGGGMENDDSSPTVTNCTFSGNSAMDAAGGGMVNSTSSSMVTNCTFSGNSAVFGGGMANYGSSSTVMNCTFSGNSAHNQGGGMQNWASSAEATNCTFSGNSAEWGSGMYNDDSSPIVTNCILWDGGNEIYNDLSSVPLVTYCDVQGGYSGEGNIDADPLFRNPAADDYHLQSSSPCIDVGDNSAPSLPSTDFEGDRRISNNVVDIGVDECIRGPYWILIVIGGFVIIVAASWYFSRIRPRR